MEHVHKAGMTYFTHPKYTDGDIQPMHIYAAWADVTEQGRGVLVAGYDPKVPAAMKPIAPGTPFVLPPHVRELAEAGTAIATTRQAAAEAMANGKRVALQALEGGITETDVAVSLGVDRQAVREWAGKRRRRAV